MQLVILSLAANYNCSILQSNNYLMRLHFTIILWLCLHGVFAQKRPIQHYTIRDGLAQQQVIIVLEDSRGYIWCGTKGGISKFDGQHFENFSTEDGLYGNGLENLFEDSKGNIWVQYINSSFGRIDGSAVKNFEIKQGRYSTITEYKNNMLYCRADSMFTIKNNKEVYWHIKGLPVGARLFTDTKTQELYLGSEKGLWLYNAKSHNFNFLINNSTSFAFRNIKKELIYATSENGLTTVYHLKNRQLHKIFSQAGNGTIQTFEAFPHDFHINNEKQIPLYYNAAEKTVEEVPIPIAGLYQSNLMKKTGYIYIGGENGLYKMATNGFKYFEQSQVPYAWGVTEAKDGTIWIQSYLSNLQQYTGQKIKNIKDYYQNISESYTENGIAPNTANINGWYYRPLKDQYGKLWFNNLEGVLVKDGNKNTYIHGRPQKGDFITLAEDPQRNKILGGSQGGLTIVENSPPYNFSFVTDTATMFQHSRFTLAVAVDKAGYYWLGGRTIARYNPDTKQIKYYTRYNKKAQIERVSCLRFDSYGGLWAGSFFNGLAHYNPKTDTFDNVFDNYFKNKTANFIGQITDKYLLVGDQLNLNVIDLEAFYKTGQQKVIKVLNQHNGFVGLEPGQDGFFKDSKGRVWVPSGTVLSYFDPSKMDFDKQDLQIFIRKINKQRLAFNLDPKQAIRLEPNVNEVVIEAEALGEGKAAIAEFSYRIPGLLPNWSAWQAERRIHIGNMPKGQYTIEIRAKHNLLNDQLHPAKKLTFEVDIPFYKSPDFYQKAFFAFLGLTGLMCFGFWAYQRKNHEAKQNKIRSKKLEQKIKTLQIQSTQAQLNPHFIFNVLQTVQSDILIKNNPKEASENIINLSDLIRSFLNTSIMDSDNYSSIYKLEISLEEEINLLKSYINFEKSAKKNFDYQINIISPLNAANYRLQPLLIQPFVENAIKHGFQGFDAAWQLNITFREEDEKLLCRITDNGIGRAKAREVQAQSIRKYKSLGTDLVYNRIQLLNTVGYNIHVHTIDKAHGTEVQLSIDFEGTHHAKI
jgi:ligand-binding sensor domain-containing protein/two-component sensor histidine kinase